MLIKIIFSNAYIGVPNDYSLSIELSQILDEIVCQCLQVNLVLHLTV